MTEYILTLDKIEKTFKPDVFKPAIRSLKGVSLNFPPGTCTGLVGHNGAGKTTTIRMILGLTTPDRGKILFRGNPIKRTDRQHIGYMAESVRFPLGLTCYEILKAHVGLYPKKDQRPAKVVILEMLKNVGLDSAAHRQARSLSKGMQQRLAWAQATIHGPSLLILDEPFTGLDPLGRMMMKKWILAEKKKGLSILLCTHELPQITSLCSQIHILQKGVLVYSSVGNIGKESAVRNLPRYFVDFSGASKAQVENIQVTKKLPSWQTFHIEGFLVKLGFRDYADATRWMSEILTEGWVLVRCGDDNTATEEQLLTHFEEEFKS